MPATTEPAPPRAAAAPVRAGSPRLPLALRIFLLLALLLSIALGAAVAVSYRQGERIADAAVQAALAASAALQHELAARRLDEVELKIRLLAADAAFVQYIADAQGDPFGLGRGLGQALDALSIQDLLLERQAIGFDLGMVLDADGEVLARTDQLEALQQNLAELPFVRDAVAQLVPLSGYWRLNDVLYHAAVFPLAQGGDLIGFLLIARRIDDVLAVQVGRSSMADIAYLLPRGEGIEIVGSSLPASERSALADALRQENNGLAAAVRSASARERVELALAGNRWIGQLRPLDADGGGMVGAALQLASADQAAAGYRAILNAVALTGLVALVIALPLSLLLAKLSLRPLSTMARAAKAAAAGDYDTQLAIGGRDELAELSQAFDSLLSDLRGERDIESYVTHLSRLMPDPADEPTPLAIPTPPPAVREFALLLAVEQRGLTRELAGLDAAAALATVERWSAPLTALASASEGQLVAAGGARLLFAFSGGQRAVAARRLLQGLWLRWPQASAALAEGEVLVGSLVSGDTAFPLALGPACQQTELLLADAPPGQALLPRALGEAWRDGSDSAPVVLKGLAGKSYYGLGPAQVETSVDAAPGSVTADSGQATVVAGSAGGTSGSTRPASAGAGRSGADDIRPGQRFGDRYQILSVLGSGGMGVVYKARDLELDDVVALKMLKPAALADREHLERLKSEIRLARRITHPNVLRTFDFGEHDGLPYISMEYVRGMTLRYLIEQTGRVPYTAALRIARQLCAGLQAAHAVGVLHRDIKPENLILEASGNAKLMDFGIARPIRRAAPGQTEPGSYVGTPNYSPPEQLAGLETDARADVYACGVLLCEMFCGGLPYQGSAVELYMAQMHGAPTPPSSFWPEVPPALEALILSCIASDRDARCPDVAMLAAELGRLRA
jgi:eukaryotic-like serine/threonine-protein kinase